MFSVHTRRILSLVVAGAAVCCCGMQTLMAATAPNVIYSATGTFASPPVSGNDLLGLAGQPFSISVVANAASVPKSHGANWALYAGLTMKGTVQSATFGSFPIQNRSTSIELATGNPSYDLFTMGTPVNVIGILISVKARITMPTGTIANALIHPFSAPVTLTPANATLTYSDTTASTTLAMASGTLNAVLGATATPAGSAMLLPEAAQTIMAHADGTQSARPASSAPIDFGTSARKVVSQACAFGVSGASEVHVRIGGGDARVPRIWQARAAPALA